MKLKGMLLVLAAMLLSGCGDEADKAIGIYSHDGAFASDKIFAEVKKDGDTYLFVGDAINNKHIIALAKGPDGLSYNNIPLKLSEDGSQLYFGRINALRAEKKDMDAYIALLEQRELLCKELAAEVKVKAADKSISNKEWNAYIETIDKQRPHTCYIPGGSARYF